MVRAVDDGESRRSVVGAGARTESTYPVVEIRWKGSWRTQSRSAPWLVRIISVIWVHTWLHRGSQGTTQSFISTKATHCPVCDFSIHLTRLPIAPVTSHSIGTEISS